jgi:hypothetical protein
VLVDGYVAGVQPTQATMANLVNTTTGDGNTLLQATSTRDFRETFTLTHTTKLDFLIDDYYLPDNGGGVTLDINPLGASSVPEPAAVTMLGVAAVIGVCLTRSRRRAQ